ncbi:MAG: metalloregulator ArsR/SmtB family transcription factor [Phycisphaerae bacterium]|jgi:ArsR family transcriptional regulator
MKPKTKQLYEARAKVAKALAHPSRQLMLDALAESERCVADLTELVGVDQSTVSKHLGVLKNAGIVDDRKEGSMTFYRLKIKCLRGFWSCVESVLKQNLDEQRVAMRR